MVLAGCASDLERVNERVVEQVRVHGGNCRDHVRAVVEELEALGYRPLVIRTVSPWMPTPHVSVLVDGWVLDNGALWHGRDPFPVGDLTIPFRVVRVPEH